MYINFKLAKEKGISPNEIMNLQVIKQMKLENELDNVLASTLEDNILERFENESLITQIKGKATDSELSRIRLSKKGIKLLDDLETANVTEEDIKIYDWVSSFYRSQDKTLGNQKRTKSGLAQFRVETSISRNHLAFLFQTFMNDDEQLEYSHKLENLIFSSKNLYSRKFSLDECRLHSYYLNKEEWFLHKFANIKN